jgi:bifunctional non-homologous end joining protein LigD
MSRNVERLEEDGAEMFAHACRLGLEGIVSKRLDLPYRSGRYASWIKTKNPAYKRGQDSQPR